MEFVASKHSSKCEFSHLKNVDARRVERLWSKGAIKNATAIRYLPRWSTNYKWREKLTEEERKLAGTSDEGWIKRAREKEGERENVESNRRRGLARARIPS